MFMVIIINQDSFDNNIEFYQDLESAEHGYHVICAGVDEDERIEISLIQDGGIHLRSRAIWS